MERDFFPSSSFSLQSIAHLSPFRSMLLYAYGLNMASNQNSQGIRLGIVEELMEA